MSGVYSVYVSEQNTHKVPILRAGEDPGLALALAIARANGLRLDDVLDRRADEASTASDEDNRLG